MILGSPVPKTKTQLLNRLRGIILAGSLDMPTDVARYNGTGGPGNYLEDLLGLTGGNKDIADCVGWEVKFHTPKTSLITLFHKEPEPEGILRYMVSKYGWKDKYGRLSFRHTIHGQSDRFTVVNDAGTIIVRHISGDDPVPMWTHVLWRVDLPECITSRHHPTGGRTVAGPIRVLQKLWQINGLIYDQER